MATSYTDPADHPRRNRADEDEFLRLLMQHQRLLFVYLRTLLNGSTDAEEVLQETYVILWRKCQQFEPGTSFLNWAMTVAQFEVRKFRRTRKQQPQRLSDTALFKISSEMIGEEGLVEARHRALGHCLEKLTERDRNLVAAAYNSNATKKNIGERLGMSSEGFWKAIQRVRHRLMKCIEHRLRTEDFA